MNYSIEEFDKAKTKVMNYIMYKKRTEYEVRTKFSKILEENLLNDIIEYVKDAGYLSDKQYVERAVTEFMVLKCLSRKEMQYKLLSKGIKDNLIDEYFSKHSEELYEYEMESAKKITIKKAQIMESNEIKNYLRKKGYVEDIIKEL